VPVGVAAPLAPLTVIVTVSGLFEVVVDGVGDTVTVGVVVVDATPSSILVINALARLGIVV
jgi:hypothetical protein